MDELDSATAVVIALARAVAGKNPYTQGHAERTTALVNDLAAEVGFLSMLHNESHSRSRRQGVILLVVVSLLMLFAIVGISFVMYAASEAKGSLLQREAQVQFRPDVDPELLAAFALGQLIYDVADDASGVFSALRGHSLARSMYGWNDSPGSVNVVPYSGTGRLHYQHGLAPLNASWLTGKDDFLFVNYLYHPGEGFLRDPERLNWRANLTTAKRRYTGGFNAPYTYPDLNNMFLAAVKADGTVLSPSFFREWTGIGALDPANNKWRAPNEFKYLTLRPHNSYHDPGFPLPELGGDVKNLIGGPGLLLPNGQFAPNDSIWMDLGFPVRKTPEGLKYKPLFAFLVTDLDNRINLNVHGNKRGASPNFPSFSNQGWGPWEVNPQKVITDNQDRVRIFHGSGAPQNWFGRYGTNLQPGAGITVPSGTNAHYYGQVDYDGHRTTINPPFAPVPGPSGRYWLAGEAGHPNAQAPWPHYPPTTGYDNGANSEREKHPQQYNYFSLSDDDRRFVISNMEAPLRYGDTGSPALTSHQFQLCPTTFSNAKLRGLVTTHSFDVDRPGVTPYVYNLATGNPNNYRYDPTHSPMPFGDPLPFPDPAKLRNLRPRNFSGEFTPDAWRAVSAALGRVNLNRKLTPYPLVPVGSSQQTMTTYRKRFDATAFDAQQFLQAQQDRQKLADDIYRRLLHVAGPPPVSTPAAPPPAELPPRRCLAQLAVNIVDFIDEDDIATPFNFYNEADGLPANRLGDGAEAELPMYWVFGTELPHLVLNEVLAEYNNTADPDYNGVWVELYNPFQTPPAGQPLQAQDGFPVPLRIPEVSKSFNTRPGANGPYAPFKVVIANRLAVAQFNENVLGKPDEVRVQTDEPDFASPVVRIDGQPQPPQPLLPNNTPYVDLAVTGDPNRSPFFLLGPVPHHDLRSSIALTHVPGPTPILRSTQVYDAMRGLEFMRYLDSAFPQDRNTGPNAIGITVLLRRLANPHLPYDNEPFRNGAPNPWYNPYVTMDYQEKLPLRNGAGTDRYHSRGKWQPYASQLFWDAPANAIHPNSSIQEQQPNLVGVNTQHTFGKLNLPQTANPGGVYDWLVHLDRQLISPVELLHVSGLPPHQFLQEFMSVDPAPPNDLRKFWHRAPWFDEDLRSIPNRPSHRLYRLFELVGTHPRSEGVGPGARIPGKININTIWDVETFLALCDAQPGNSFYGPNPRDPDRLVRTLFNRFLMNADPSTNQLARTKGPGGVPGPVDLPFWGLSLGHYPANDPQFAGRGIKDTLFRFVAAPTNTHPYRAFELPTKIFNNVTTRSNVFAVWMTVGFFEVTDESARPPKLGAEIGKAENRHIRHRMFSIVDRTNLSIATDVRNTDQQIPTGSQTVTLSPLNLLNPNDQANRARWATVQVGSTVLVGVGDNQEAVVVTAASANSFQAVFTKQHNTPQTNPPTRTTPISLPHLVGDAPVFLKSVRVEPIQNSNPPQYWVTVPVGAPATTQQLAGNYEGVSWSILPVGSRDAPRGTGLILGHGAREEFARVLEVAPDPNNTALGRFRVALRNPPDDPLTIGATILGNPGPQPRFSLRQAPYSSVVRYLSIIQ